MTPIWSPEAVANLVTAKLSRFADWFSNPQIEVRAATECNDGGYRVLFLRTNR
jgi:hypothetical protein